MYKSQKKEKIRVYWSNKYKSLKMVLREDDWGYSELWKVLKVFCIYLFKHIIKLTAYKTY